MKVSGVITEYNPFHNGHKYQLEQIKQETGADYIIVAMSGNFVQRGNPALLDKYTRAKIALSNGADLVLEIPTIYACSSAEYFAQAGVSLLNSTGVVSTLCYGVEEKSDTISTIANLLNNPTDKYNSKIAFYTKNGDSFPVARKKALLDIMPDHQKDETERILSTPNNILAIEYEKALQKTNIIGHQIIRIGEGYHSTSLNTNFASASAIRDNIRKNLKDNASIESIKKCVPETTYESLTNTSDIVFSDDVSGLLYYKLLANKATGFIEYADCSEELSSKIINNIYKYESFSQFCGLLKSKNYTYTRISRVLTHILLDIKRNDYSSNLSNSMYLRVLGFKRDSSALLHEIKEKASVPLITKVADASSILSPSALYMFDKDIFAADLYSSLKPNSYNEYTHPLIIIS